MRPGIQFNGYDISIIVFNFLAFLLQLWMPEGSSSVVAFMIFSLVLFAIFSETYSAYGMVKSTFDSGIKLVLYIITCIVLIAKGGQQYVFNAYNIIMFSISLVGITIGYIYRLNKSETKTSLLIRAQNLALLLGTVSYCIAVLHHPEQFGIYSIIFWLLHILSYVVVCAGMHKKQTPKPAYIFPVFGITRCIAHCIFILVLMS